MNKKTITDLIQRVDTGTMTSIMAKVLKLPPKWQMEFALDLCRVDRNTKIPRGVYERRLNAAFKNDAFRAWTIANEDKIPTV